MSTSAENLFRNGLLADSTVAGYLAARLYEVQLPPQPSYPAACYQRISDVPKYVHVGPSAQGALIHWLRFQVSIWTTGAGAGAVGGKIADAIIAALNTFDMSTPPGSPQVVPHTPNFLLNRRHTNEPNTQPPLSKIILDIGCWYVEQ